MKERSSIGLEIMDVIVVVPVADRSEGGAGMRWYGILRCAGNIQFDFIYQLTFLFVVLRYEKLSHLYK